MDEERILVILICSSRSPDAICGRPIVFALQPFNPKALRIAHNVISEVSSAEPLRTVVQSFLQH